MLRDEILPATQDVRPQEMRSASGQEGAGPGGDRDERPRFRHVLQRIAQIASESASTTSDAFRASDSSEHAARPLAEERYMTYVAAE